MSTITPVTLWIAPNEKAWAYIEMDEQSPSSRGFHRYKLIYVNRDDKITEYREDMGESKKFKAARKTIHIPSVWEHTVAELEALATELRYEHEKDEMEVRELAGVFPFTKPWAPKNYK